MFFEALKSNSSLTLLKFCSINYNNNNQQKKKEMMKRSNGVCSVNKIGSDDAKALGETLKSNMSLTSLFLSGNKIE